MNDSTHQWRFGEKGSAPLQPAGRRSFIALMVFFGVAFVAAVGVSVYEGWQLRREALGHGRTADSYGFDLSNLNVNPDTLVPSRMLRDEQPVLGELPPYDHGDRSEPAYMTVAQVDEYSDYPLWPVIHGEQVVIGTVIEGEARAYPLDVMRGHEIINDVLGGEPIAVTYSPLSDSAAIFDRRLGDETLTFGFSGLLSNSNLVMYDVREGEAAGGASLWSQIRMRAISGPRAGESASNAARLTLTPAWVGRWEEWRAMHPETTALVGGRAYRKAYGREQWVRYYQSGEPVFPVDRLPEGEREVMTPIIVHGREDDGWMVREVPAQGRDEPLTPTISARWFAWYAAWGE